MNTHEIPYGYCECGCGLPAPIAKKTSTQYGWVKGQPTRFIHGHNDVSRPALERFWEKVEKLGKDDCWLWTGTHNRLGYGALGIKGVDVSTHRFSYEIHKGPIPDGLWVLHKCDNPPCCNPNHLFLGTHQDNMADKKNKGRQARGESVGNDKLTEDQVRQIRHRRANGEGRVAMAKEYGVSDTAITRITKYKTWKHVE